MTSQVNSYCAQSNRANCRHVTTGILFSTNYGPIKLTVGTQLLVASSIVTAVKYNGLQVAHSIVTAVKYNGLQAAYSIVTAVKYNGLQVAYSIVTAVKYNGLQVAYSIVTANTTDCR